MPITQRLSLRLTGATALAAIMAVVMAVSAMPVASAQSQAHRPATPKRGGTLSYVLGTQPDCLDSAKSAELQSIIWSASMTDNLVEQDPKGKFIADLATTWKFGNHGKKLTFNLRHGVKFTNGHAVTAGAVAANLRRPENSFALGPLTAVTTSGKYTLTMKFSAAYRPILSNLAFLVPIFDPKTINKNDCESTSLAGTGPFKLTNVGPGLSSVTLGRYPKRKWKLSYGKNKGPAYLSSLQLVTIANPEQSATELLSGQVDIAGISPSQLPRFQGSNISIHESLGQQAWWLGFNCKRKPFNNPKVRFAIGEAINRKAIIKTGLNGLGKPIDSIVPPSEPFSDPSAKSYAPSYNLKAAKKVFKKFHVKGPYTLLGFNGTYAPDAEAIAADLEAAGVKVNVVLKDIPDALAAADAGDFDFQLNGYGATDPDFLYVQFDSVAGKGPNATNTTFYKSKKLDHLIVAGREAVNANSARKDYYAAERFIVHTAAIVDPIFDPINAVGLSSRVGGYHRNVFNLYPLWQDLYVK